jgi:hypothetical protein
MANPPARALVSPGFFDVHPGQDWGRRLRSPKVVHVALSVLADGTKEIPGL